MRKVIIFLFFILIIQKIYSRNIFLDKLKNNSIRILYSDELFDRQTPFGKGREIINKNAKYYNLSYIIPTKAKSILVIFDFKNFNFKRYEKLENFSIGSIGVCYKFYFFEFQYNILSRTLFDGENYNLELLPEISGMIKITKHFYFVAKYFGIKFNDDNYDIEIKGSSFGIQYKF